jgi:hypothetical protein
MPVARSGISQPSVVVVAITLTVAAAFFVALWWVSTPNQETQRLDSIAASNSSAGPESGLAGACHGDAASQRDAYAEKVAQAALASGITLDQSDITPEVDERPVTSLQLSLAGRAVEDAVTNFLEALAGEQPQLFVRSLDLQPRNGMVEMHLEGAIWCVA